MKEKQRKFNNEFKAKVAVDAIKGRKTIAELCTEFSVHSTQISNWKKQVLDNIKMIFDNGKIRDNNFEAKMEELYKQIGKLQVENDFLKKSVYRS